MKRWTLAKVYAESWAAPIVWVALLEMRHARGSPVVTPTRGRLAKATGIDRLKTISTALTALEHAGWIERCHVPKFKGGMQTATVLRIEIIEAHSRRGRRTPHTAQPAVEGAPRPNSKGRVLPQDFPTGRGTPRAEGGGIPKNQRTPTAREIQERADQRDREDRERLLGVCASKAGKVVSLPVGERAGHGSGVDTPAVF